MAQAAAEFDPGRQRLSQGPSTDARPEPFRAMPQQGSLNALAGGSHPFGVVAPAITLNSSHYQSDPCPVSATKGLAEKPPARDGNDDEGERGEGICRTERDERQQPDP